MKYGAVDLYRCMILLQKELRDLLRDRRVLVSAVFLPAILIPLLMLFSNRAIEIRGADSGRVNIGLLGRGIQTIAYLRIFPDANWMLASDADLVLTGQADVLLERRVDREGTVSYRISYDGGSANSMRARDLLKARLGETFERDQRKRLMEAMHIHSPEGLPPRLSLEVRNLGLDEAPVASPLPGILPMLLVLVLISASAFAALDLFPGEHERGTLETLLVQPIDRIEILLAKSIAVFAVGYTSILVNLGAFYIVSFLGLGQFAGHLDLSLLLLLGFAAAPMAFLLSALLVRVLATTQTVREGQHYLMPLALLCILPAFLAGRPEIPLRIDTSLVPLLGPALSVREILQDGTNYLLLTLSAAASFVYALWILNGAKGWLLSREELLGRAQAGSARLGRAWMLILGSILCLFTLGPLFQSLPVLLRISVPLLLFVFLPLVLFARSLGTSHARLFSIHGLWRPSMLLGLSSGLGMILMSSSIASLQEAFLPIPESYRAAAAEALGGTALPVLGTIVVLGLLPGIFEELLYRRFFLGSLLEAHRPSKAVVLAAAMFGMHHLSIYRFLPSFAAGLALGLLVIETRCFWAAPIAHALSNSLASLTALPGAPLADTEWATFLLHPDYIPARLSIGLLLVCLPILPRLARTVRLPGPRAMTNLQPDL